MREVPVTGPNTFVAYSWQATDAMREMLNGML